MPVGDGRRCEDAEVLMRFISSVKALSVTHKSPTFMGSVCRKAGVEYFVHIGKALHGYPEDELRRHATGPDIALHSLRADSGVRPPECG